jgi:hypothetical protein
VKKARFAKVSRAFFLMESTLLVHRVVVAVLVVSGAAAHAADKPGCSDPDWARSRLEGFEISSCSGPRWAPLELSLKAGRQQLEGDLSVVIYALVDKAKNPGPREALEHYASQARALGAEPIGGNDYNVSFRLKDRVLFYEHTGGNDKSTSAYRLRTLRIAPLPISVEAKPMAAPLAPTAPCADPPWLAKPMPGFRRTTCSNKPWAQHRAGDKVYEGRRSIVNYEIIDPQARPHPAAVRRNFIEALKASGAEPIVADESEGHELVFAQKGAAGQFWSFYGGTGGNSTEISTFHLVTLQEAPLEQEVEARAFDGTVDTQTCADPPWLSKNVSGFTRTACKSRDFDAVELKLADGKKIVAGRVHEALYRAADAKAEPFPEAVRLQFLRALEKIGATPVSDPKDHALMIWRLKTAHGDAFIEWRGTGGSADDLSTFALATVVPPAPTRSCTLEVYGVNFDFDKATLRPDAAPVLEQLLAMLKEDSAFSGEVGGHTDNVGKPEHNATLSSQRAEAVKAWLGSHGIAANRLSTHGYGDSRPLVPNDSEENRARNRRVELKRDHCTVK